MPVLRECEITPRAVDQPQDFGPVPSKLRQHRLRIGLSAARSMIRRPTSVDPVNDTTRGTG
jgi:hypothetical protein